MSDAVSHEPAGSGSAPSPNDHRIRVLYVEHSAEQRARVRAAIEASGIELDEAADAHEAIDRAGLTHPDLVLVDTHLNGTAVRDVARELRGATTLHDVPFVAHGGVEDKDACLGAGFDGFLNEPLDESKLPEQLRSYLRAHRDGPEQRIDALERALAGAVGESTRLREQSRVRGDFMRNLAHELATPLTPLVGYLKLLRSGRLGPLSEKQTQVVDAMTHAADRLGHSIDNLVDYSSLETGKYRVIAMDFDASPMVDEAVEETRARAKMKHLRVDVRRPDHVAVKGDERKLKQALMNMIENAVKVSPHGGHVLVEVKDQPDRVSFSVFDQGPGLPPEVRRANETAEPIKPDERAGGVGLGLPVARQIVTAHHGEITLESPPKDQPDSRDLFPGSRVGFWIPHDSSG